MTSCSLLFSSPVLYFWQPCKGFFWICSLVLFPFYLISLGSTLWQVSSTLFFISFPSPFYFICFLFAIIFILFPPHIYFFLFYFILEKICSTFLYFSQDTNNNFFSKIKEVSDHEFERSKRWGPWDKLEEERWERNNYNLIKIFFRLVYPFNWICYILFILH